MMDAWEQLVSGSTITTGDAWEHLMAQGGGGVASYIVLSDGLEVEMGANEIVVEIKQADVDVVVDLQDIEVAVDQSPLGVEI